MICSVFEHGDQQTTGLNVIFDWETGLAFMCDTGVPYVCSTLQSIFAGLIIEFIIGIWPGRRWFALVGR